MNDLLDLCLQPKTTKEEFFSKYWQKAPLHTRIPHSSTSSSENNNEQEEEKESTMKNKKGINRFEPIFRLADLEFLWATTMKVDPSSMLFFQKGGDLVSVIRSAFYAFAHQISVVVNKADRLSPAILNICESFQKHFPFVYCNVYSTPASERTVPCHTDDRDVFVLQVHGAKHWTVWEDPPITLPYKHEEIGKYDDMKIISEKTSSSAAASNSSSANSSPTSSLVELATSKKIAFEGIVETGDMLYLPRGFAHVAKAVTSSPSVHLTIAVQTSDWDCRSLIQDGISSAIETVVKKSSCSGSSSSSSSSVPPEFILRSVMPPNLLSKVVVSSSEKEEEEEKEKKKREDVEENNTSSLSSLLHSEENENDYASTLKSSLQLVTNHLLENPHLCLERFRDRLQLRKDQRRQFYQEHVSTLRFLPLTMSTLLIWNQNIKIISIQKMGEDTKKIGNVDNVVVMRRKKTANQEQQQQQQNKSASAAGEANEGDTIQVIVSDAVLDVLKLWQELYCLCPGSLSEMMMVLARYHRYASATSTNNSNNNSIMSVDTSLQAYCVASFLLRNGCMSRC